MKKALSALLVLFPTIALASGPKTEILNLTHSIEDALLDSSANTQALTRAKQDLIEALRLISGNENVPTQPSNSRGACIDFAYSKYFAETSSTNATLQASAACKKIADLAVAEYLWTEYFKETGSSKAMDQAANGATIEVAGKLDIIRFARDKYFADTGAINAANKALTLARKVPVGSLDCLAETWKRFFADTGSSNAMDEAGDSCTQ